MFCDKLTNIVIPNSVSCIGFCAFSGKVQGTNRRKIFCEARKKPGRWHWEWTDYDVYWKDEWYYDENGEPVAKEK